MKVRSSGGVGSLARLTLRGLDGPRVAIFIDGVPILAREGGPVLSDIPLPFVQRIEVYKGIVPVEFGGDGLGSAINIVTRQRQSSYVDIGYTGGSYNTHRVFLSARYAPMRSRFAADATLIGDFADNNYKMPGLPPDSLVVRGHDRLRQVYGSVGFEVKHTFFDLIRFDLGAGLFSQELQGLPKSEFLRNDIRQARFLSQSYFARFSLAKEAGRVHFTYLADVQYRPLNFRDLAYVQWDFDGHEIPNPNGRGEVGYGPNDTHDLRIDLRQRVNLRYRLRSAHTFNLNSFLVGGFKRVDDPVADEAAGFRVTPLPGNLFTSVTSFSYQGDFFRDRLMVVGGIKHLFFHADGSPTSVYEVVTNQTITPLSEDRNAAGANAGVRYRFHPSFLAKLSYEYAVRAPRTEEIFGNGFTIQGSINLAPETSHNLNLGLRFDRRSRHITVRAEADGFAAFADDLITLIGAATPQYANVTQARILGVEFDVQADLVKHLRLYVNGTYNDARNTTQYFPGTTQPSYLYGLRLPNTPYLFGNYGAEIFFPSEWLSTGGQTRLYYDASYVESYFYDYQLSERQSRGIPSYFIHSVGIQQSVLSSHLSFNFEALNLGDAQRYDEFARPLPGRTFRVFVRGTFY